MQVAVPGGVRGPALNELLELLRLEVNVKEIEVVASDTDLVRLRPKPNFRTLGKRYGKRTPAVAAAAAGLTPGQLRSLEDGSPATLELEGEPVTYLPEDVAVEREVASDWLVQSNGAFVAALDPRLDETLRREGLAREVVNRVQRIRKEAGYAYTDRIALWIDGDAHLLDAVSAHSGFIRGETLARCLEMARAPTPDLEQQVDIDGHGAVVGVQRYQDGRAESASTMDE
jgi:isoleucyl-tRNA synthetase